MGRRSSFPRRPHDSFDTPEKAVLPLLPQLLGLKTFAEPCCGNGVLVRHLEAHGLRCAYQGDILHGQDALAFGVFDAEVIITNPPWTRQLLHPLIKHFAGMGPAWLLFDFSWACTLQAAPLIPHCELILPVGRISWMGNGVDAKDDVAWFKFDGRHDTGPVVLPRAA